MAGLSPDDYGLKPDKRLHVVVNALEQELAPGAGPPPAPANEPEHQPTDLEYVAVALDRLRYRQHKELASELWGATPPTSAAELADRLDDWVNKTIKPLDPYRQH